MKNLVAIFEAAGCADVITYIQSGNVVFKAGAALAKTLPAALEVAILERAKLRVPVTIRSAAALSEIAKGNPFLTRRGAGAATDPLYVSFAAAAPSADKVAALDPKRSPPDEFVVKGREIYLRLPNGVGKTKLTNAYFDSKLGTPTTVRNWRTVLKLLEMSAR